MMRKVVAVVFSLAFGRMAMAETVSFDADAAGAPPRGWTITMTGRGNPKWTVEKDDTAPSKSNVLKQSGKATYPLALKDGTSIKDGFVEVKFKALSSSEDRAAGLVWRAKDANNYYVVRANAPKLTKPLADLATDFRNKICQNPTHAPQQIRAADALLCARICRQGMLLMGVAC